MKSKGNSMPQQCTANLLQIVRGEVPYDRVKGLNAALLDQPSQEAGPQLAADAAWLIETYEPRVDVNETEVQAQLAQAGLFAVCGKVDGGR